MKEIIVACGSGVATSTAVLNKVATLLDENGYQGAYHISQCAIAEAVGKSQTADLLIATTAKPDNIGCPFISGVCFLTGIGIAAAQQQILDCMKN